MRPSSTSGAFAGGAAASALTDCARAAPLACVPMERPRVAPMRHRRPPLSSIICRCVRARCVRRLRRRPTNAARHLTFPCFFRCLPRS
eukprot:6936826-Prymnesium_polylepis.1